MSPDFVDRLVKKNTTKIVFLILDGIGGIPHPSCGQTELEKAHTPNLDALAAEATCGMLDPIGYGITPGSGPAHFALFGYDPLVNNVGRGLLEAAGIDFPMTEKDLFIRSNFATMGKDGKITDRRAGRIDTETNERLCRKLQDGVCLSSGVKVFFKAVKEHRGLIVLRGDYLQDEIAETDPEEVGKPPLPPKALSSQAKETADILDELIAQSRQVLADEEKANMILMRGFARYRKYPSFQDRFHLKSLSIANYPMYRGITRLLGMDVHPLTGSVEGEFQALENSFDSYDFFYVHIKHTDSKGEDGNFEGKIAVIEDVDALIPRITALEPDVLVVTGDHSTPAVMAAHSWHPVPVLIHARMARPDGARHFGERDCMNCGSLGRIPMVNLMPLALAHAQRLAKFGA